MDFLSKNKVFFLGLIASLTVIVQQFAMQPTVDWPTFGFAVLMAALSYIANCWRGQGVTLTGIIGTLAGVFVTNYSGGHINAPQFIMLALAAILAAVAPPPKPQSYEDNPVIKNAQMIIVLFLSITMLSSCAFLQKAMAPKFDSVAVTKTQAITTEVDNFYNSIAQSSDKTFSTYQGQYETVSADISALVSYDSTRKNSATLTGIVRDTKGRFETYRIEHSNYKKLNNSQILSYKEGMDALLNIILRTELNLKN